MTYPKWQDGAFRMCFITQRFRPRCACKALWKYCSASLSQKRDDASAATQLYILDLCVVIRRQTCRTHRGIRNGLPGVG